MAYWPSRIAVNPAVLGAEALVALHLDNPAVFLPFILMCCFVNLMLGSASAQWAVTAPIFVPMLMTVGYSPEVIQAAYRIGDSSTNVITPMMSYFGLILAVATRYKKDLGIGTMVATMLPYSIAFLIGWIISTSGSSRWACRSDRDRRRTTLQAEPERAPVIRKRRKEHLPPCCS